MKRKHKKNAAPSLSSAPELLSLCEVAGILRVSYTTAYRLIMQRTEIPHFRVGAVIRVRFEDVQAYISNRLNTDEA